MAETVEQAIPEFNPTDYLKQANERQAAQQSGKVLPVIAAKAVEPIKETAKVEEKTTEQTKEAKEDHEAARLPRSARRELNRLREQAAEERGRRIALEEMIRGNGKQAEPKADDPEPQREQFATDSEYNRAAGRWDARQEAKKTVAEANKGTQAEKDQAAFTAHVVAMDKKAAEDIKSIPDWDEVAKAASEDEDAPEFSAADHPEFVQMLSMSDVKARMLYHLAKNPDVFQKLLDMTGDFGAQLSAFKRLEGKVEMLYTAEQKQEAAQASDKGKAESKDRNHPAEAQAGRNSLERDAQKSRPSTEVAARGGTATPEEPAIGSPAWMAKRNQVQFSR